LKAETNQFHGLIPWLAFGLVLTLVEAVNRNASLLFSRRLQDELNLSITEDILEHAASLDVSAFEDPATQDIMDRAQQNTAGRFSQFVANTLGGITTSIQIVTLACVLVAIEPLVSVVILLLAAPYLVFHWRLARLRYAKERARSTKRRWTRYYVSHLISNRMVPEVKMLGLAPLLIQKFRTLMTEFRDQDRRLYIRGFAGGALFSLMSATAFTGVFVWIAFQAVKGALTVGDVALFAGVTSRMGRMIEGAIQSIANASEQALYISNLVEFLGLRPSAAADSGLTPEFSDGDIDIRDVFFSYPGSDRVILADLSLKIRPQETVALVGENGAGKTTLVKLIAGLYPADKGQILLDGLDTRELAPDYLRKQVAFVFQDFGRYEGTVAENIAYGDWKRLLDKPGEIERVARLADVHEMIEHMPDGYDTLLGRGFGTYSLSGGQWQRLAVARAFARNAPILILDEPTSNLDARSEYELFRRFRELARGRTTILISHRFSTVSMADRILVMDGGRIVEEGSHEALLAAGGLYSTLYKVHQSQMVQPLSVRSNTGVE
jgi:ATP-binding cassette subfamily B protein